MQLEAIPDKIHVPEVDRRIDEGKDIFIDEVLMSLLTVINQIV